MNTRMLALLGLGVAGTTVAWGQARPTPAATESVTVVADSTFGRGRFGRWLLGDHYRDLWATPLRVEVLDLGRYAGGLTPLVKGGGNQTVSLHLKGTDGREYVFRLLRKNPEPIVRRLRSQLVAGVIRDGMSAMHPGGTVVVPAILEAAGVLHPTPVLRYLPDDARLGAFRAEFGNQLGTIEERPTAATDDPARFAGARRIEDTPGMIEALRRHPGVRVDARAYLTVRLVDLYVGDWDRHEGQWRWALFGEGHRAKWEPIPRDRDQAFARFDGVLGGLARFFVPELLNFTEDYPSPYAATMNGRSLDRRILTGLAWPVWDSIARALQARLTDQVIGGAVARLPLEYEAKNGTILRRTLQVRRDKLHRMAQTYFGFLAEQVRVFGRGPRAR